MRTYQEMDVGPVSPSSTTKDVSNRGQKWNVGPEHRKESETFRGCFGKRTPFLRLRSRLKIGCESSRLEIDHWTKPTQASLKTMCVWFGKWTRFLRRRTQLQDTRANDWPQFTVRIVGHWTDMTQGTRNESCGHIRKWTSDL